MRISATWRPNSRESRQREAVRLTLSKADSPLPRSVRRKRSIYAFVLLTSSDGRTEFACLPTPVASRNELGYHLSSAGPFAVHRYGARAAFEQDGGLVPGRKTLEAIKTGRRPKRLKSKSNWVRRSYLASFFYAMLICFFTCSYPRR